MQHFVTQHLNFEGWVLFLFYYKHTGTYFIINILLHLGVNGCLRSSNIWLPNTKENINKV